MQLLSKIAFMWCSYLLKFKKHTCVRDKSGTFITYVSNYDGDTLWLYFGEHDFDWKRAQFKRESSSGVARKVLKKPRYFITIHWKKCRNDICYKTRRLSRFRRFTYPVQNYLNCILGTTWVRINCWTERNLTELMMYFLVWSIISRPLASSIQMLYHHNWLYHRHEFILSFL